MHISVTMQQTVCTAVISKLGFILVSLQDADRKHPAVNLYKRKHAVNKINSKNVALSNWESEHNQLLLRLHAQHQLPW